jgi:hypothetical protein
LDETIAVERTIEKLHEVPLHVKLYEGNFVKLYALYNVVNVKV